MLFSPLYLMFGLVFRTQQTSLVPALHHQVPILQRQLGYLRFGRSSVARILKQRGLTPERRRNLGLGWLPFLAHYGRFIWGSDFCTVTAATLKSYSVVFFLEIGTGRIIRWNASTSPDEDWVAQQFRNLSVVSDDLPRYLIHDRDSKYTRHAGSLLEDVSTKVIRLPVRSPDPNASVECWIRSLRHVSDPACHQQGPSSLQTRTQDQSFSAWLDPNDRFHCRIPAAGLCTH